MLDWFFKRRKQRSSQEQLSRHAGPPPEPSAKDTKWYAQKYPDLTSQQDNWQRLNDEQTIHAEVPSQNTKYIIQYNIKTGLPDIPTVQSTRDDVINTKETDELIEKLIGQSREIESIDNLKIYKLQCAKLLSGDMSNGYCKFLVNHAEYNRTRLNDCENERVILLVGPTGGGKSTLINAMVNYIFGITFDHPVRFKLVDDERVKDQRGSQTSMVTAYVLAHEPGFRVPYTITIVDTPGFGDTNGIQQDELTTHYIEDIFRAQGIQGIDHLDAVGFVTNSLCNRANSDDNRVTAAQKYVIEAIMSIFGNDVAKNMFAFATHANSNRTTTVQEVLKAGNVPFQACFPFNNSALYLPPQEKLAKPFWDIKDRSFGRFFNHFNTLQPAALTLTNEVLDLRKSLEGYLDAVALQEKQHANILDELARETDAVKAHATEVAKNQNFTYIVPTKHVVDTPCRSGAFAVNCHECGSTCHYPCAEENVETCLVLKQKGHCLICPGHCAPKVHCKAKFHYTVEQKNEQRTFYELKKRLDIDEMTAVTIDMLLDGLKKEGEIVATKLNRSVEEAHLCQRRLGEIAIRPYAASVADYVNVLIKNEESQREEGWKVRVQILRDVTSRAEQRKSILERTSFADTTNTNVTNDVIEKSIAQLRKMESIENVKIEDRGSTKETTVSPITTTIKTAPLTKPSPTLAKTSFNDTANTNAANELIERLVGDSHEIESFDNLKICKLQCAKLPNDGTSNGHCTYLVNQAEYVGAPLNYYEKERVILLVGATGAGKSTLINGIVNYILGVTWEHPVRFKLIENELGKNETESQTSVVTAYVLAHEPGFRVPYSITIVDTPGFGDTKGIQQDELTARYIENIFRAKGIQGIDRLDAVGFVAKANDNRMTAAEKYVIGAIMRIFGNDVAKNVFIFATHADSSTTATVEKVLQTGNMPFQACFPFNNSALYKPADDRLAKLFWDIGNRSFEKFFAHFNNLQPATLTLTKEVLELRKCLEGHLDAAILEHEQQINILEELARETAAIKEHETMVENNQSFIYIVPTKHFVKAACHTGVFAVNCQDCGSTCHFPCEEESVATCCIMRQKGRCRVCPGNCAPSAHSKENFHYIAEQMDEERTFRELMERLGMDRSSIVTMANVLDKLKKDGEIIAAKLNKSVQKANHCQKRLGEIAMLPHTESVEDYVNMLIQNEKNQKKDGWQGRVEIWQDVIERAKKRKLIFDDKTFQ